MREGDGMAGRGRNAPRVIAAPANRPPRPAEPSAIDVAVATGRAVKGTTTASGGAASAKRKPPDDGPEVEALTVMLNVRVTPAERRDLKMYAVEEDTSIQDLLHCAVTGILGRRSHRPKKPARPGR